MKSGLRNLFIASSLLAILLPSAVSQVVYARADRHHREIDEERMTLDEAAAMVRQRTGGKVLSAGTEAVEDELRYRFKVLMPSGQVKVILINPLEREEHD